MCGIAGLADPRGQGLDDLRQHAELMNNVLSHRGPDSGGVQVVEEGRLVIAHRRLAVLDLSDCGNQPMTSRSGRYVISYNGEIYNHQELRRSHALVHHGFEGDSDTETLLACVDSVGLPETLRLVDGMFAFALYDRGHRELWLVRDRMGEKPLYYGTAGGRLWFASELKALDGLSDFDRTLDKRAVQQYLRYGYVPAPAAIFRDAFKLLPGHYLRQRLNGHGSEWSASEQYWSVPVHPAVRPLGVAGATEVVQPVLERAVRRRLISDVPLGVFLSGGVDSALTAACAAHVLEGTLKTFTIGFPGTDFDESAGAAATARVLGSRHTYIPVDAGQALRLVDALTETYDEPFADPSALPSMLLAAETRRHVTVAVSGDGADELFGGYRRYGVGHGLWRHCHTAPAPLRAGVARGLHALPANVLEAAARGMGRSTVAPLGQTLDKAARLASAQDWDEVYETFLTLWDVGAAGQADRARARLAGDDATTVARLSPAAKMVLFDQLVTLPDHMLVKVDRASMASSLEVRAPYVSHELVEVVAGLAFADRVGTPGSKKLQRGLLRNYLGQTWPQGPKRGFDPPIAAWLRGPLRPWAAELLGGLDYVQVPLDKSSVERAWQAHLSGTQDNAARIWAILMLAAWMRKCASVQEW